MFRLEQTTVIIPWVWETERFMFHYNFSTCEPIYKILLPEGFTFFNKDSHLAWNALLYTNLWNFKIQ